MINGIKQTKRTVAAQLEKLCDNRFKPLFAIVDLLWIAFVVWLSITHHLLVGYLYIIVFGFNLAVSYLIPRLLNEPSLGRLNRYYIFTRKRQNNGWRTPTLHFVPLFFPYCIDRTALKKERRDALKGLYRRTGARVSHGDTLTLHRINEEDPQAEYCVRMSKQSFAGARIFAGTVLLNLLNIRNYRQLEVTRKIYQLFFNALARYRYTCPAD